jgi:hypothetical protein
MTEDSKWSEELTFIMVLNRHAKADELSFISKAQAGNDRPGDNIISLHARRLTKR